jgi:hypothetical protein
MENAARASRAVEVLLLRSFGADVQQKSVCGVLRSSMLCTQGTLHRLAHGNPFARCCAVAIQEEALTAHGAAYVTA